jgi:lipoyl(octanoyl) transferase
MLEWRVSSKPIPYEKAIEVMEQRATDIREGLAPEMIWLLGHDSLYTAGTSAKRSDLLDSKGFPVYESSRGGQYTYHGPGQRIAYIMIDLAKRGHDVRAFVTAMEQWMIDTLAVFGIQGERRPGRVGIWVDNNGADQKIAALGIRLRRWVSFHGIALNVNPDLNHFQGIVPCGLSQYGVTSCQELGVSLSMGELDKALQEQWEKNKYMPVSQA